MAATRRRLRHSKARSEMAMGGVEPDGWTLTEGSWISVEVQLGDPERFWVVTALFTVHDGEAVMVELRVLPGEGDRFTDEETYFYDEDGTPYLNPKVANIPDIGEWTRSRTALEDMPVGGITARLVQSIRFGELNELMRRQLDGHRGRQPPKSPLGYDLEEATRRPGRKGRQDVDYARLAARYADKVRKGSMKPNSELGEELGLKPARVAERIHKARGRGLLTGGGQGSAGGELTAAAVELLERDKRRGRGRDEYTATRPR